MRKREYGMGAGGAVVCIGEWDVYDLWIGNGGLELHAKRSHGAQTCGQS